MAEHNDVFPQTLYLQIEPEEIAAVEAGLSTQGSNARRRSPSILDSLAELPRTMLEISALGLTWPALSATPRGDGHTVFVMPGFMAGDRSTLALRRFLDSRNLRTISWELGQNNGSFAQQEELMQRFDALLATTTDKISLVGQSLGGVYARMLAARWPDRIRQVITLGSPFASPGPDTVNSTVSRLFQYMSGMSEADMRDQMLGVSGTLEVPATAVYSRTDGVVHWSSCVDDTTAQAENIEVLGSHSGMGFNPSVLYVVADRLAQRADRWRPFKRTGCRGLIYPKPVSQPQF